MTFLANLREVTQAFRLPPADGPVLELFTDGSCLLPTQPMLRVASWAVTAAVPEHEPAHIVTSGTVPGLVQTPFRAEIMAALQAMQAGIYAERPVRIWSDCLGVVVRVGKILQGFQASPSAPNSDLWMRVEETLRELGPRFLGIVKVPAHCSFQDSEDEVTRWMLYNNSIADAAARQANRLRPAAFWDCWESVRRDVALQELVTMKVHQVHIAVAIEARSLKRYDGTGFCPRAGPCGGGAPTGGPCHGR